MNHRLHDELIQKFHVPMIGRQVVSSSATASPLTEHAKVHRVHPGELQHDAT